MTNFNILYQLRLPASLNRKRMLKSYIWINWRTKFKLNLTHEYGNASRISTIAGLPNGTPILLIYPGRGLPRYFSQVYIFYTSVVISFPRILYFLSVVNSDLGKVTTSFHSIDNRFFPGLATIICFEKNIITVNQSHIFIYKMDTVKF